MDFVGLIECDIRATTPDVRARRLEAFFVELFALLDRDLGSFRDGALERLPAKVGELAREAAFAAPGDRGAVVLHWLESRGYLREDVSRGVAKPYIRRLATHVALLALDRSLGDIGAPVIRWTARDGVILRGRAVPARDADGSDGHGSGDEGHVLPANHYDVMGPPHSRVIARRLREELIRGGGPTSAEPARPAPATPG